MYNKKIKMEKDFKEYLLKVMEERDIHKPKPKSKKEIAQDILKKLDSDPELFNEFNSLLRIRKIKRIKQKK